MKKKTRRRLRWLFILILILAAVTSLSVLYIKTELFRPMGITLSNSRFPIRGIDISKHNGIIDFDALEVEHVRFIFIKASEGVTHVDQRMEVNFRHAQEHGIAAGFYHFFRFTNNGLEQANAFLEALKGAHPDLPPVVDVEDHLNLHVHSTAEKIAQLKIFIDAIESVLKRKVIIYTNEDGYRKYVRGHFSNNPLWIASFNDPPRVDARWIIWQHSHNGRIAGINGHVDLNVFNGDEQAFQQFLAQ